MKRFSLLPLIAAALLLAAAALTASCGGEKKTVVPTASDVRQTEAATEPGAEAEPETESETEPAPATADLTIDGVRVIENGALAEGIVQVRPGVYWTVKWGDVAFYEKNGFTELIDRVYSTLSRLFGTDPASVRPLLVIPGQPREPSAANTKPDENEPFIPNTNYRGEGFRITLRVIYEGGKYNLVFKPFNVYTLGHEMTHFFYGVKTERFKGTIYPYEWSVWNEEILCESMALVMLDRLKETVDSPAYTLQAYLNDYLEDDYKEAPDKMHGDTTETAEAFSALSENYLAEYDPEIAYLSRELIKADDAQSRELIRMYDYLQVKNGSNGWIDYDAWYGDTGSELVKTVSRIQPQIVG